ncbi:MAG: UDP-N-acetylmuramate--L-alanine ligase [Streptosporangiales bacterium]|nr:UDP-N-acetylmuramate--L-alanine ligase [Streptosporangiales bacterium]
MTGLVTPVDPVPLEELGKVHFVGIGGAGMSGIAKIMLARGTQVSGSDSAASEALDALASLGAKTHVGHAAGNLGDADTLVVSSAIRSDNPELAEARRRGLRVLHRSSALAAVMHGRRVIAVTGTHGKTSTTSMIATILLETGAEPGYAIGGTLAAAGTNAADGAGTDFVAEADESDGSFLNYASDAAVITNIEADHLDNYGTPENYQASFGKFIARVNPGGLLVTCADDPGTVTLAEAARGLGLRVRTYGESDGADYRVGSVSVSGMETSFTVTGSEDPFGDKSVDLVVGVPGRHNALNAAAAFAVVTELGADPDRTAPALRAYRGAARRMEPKGEAAGVRVLDTYAHHPTELAADLRAARDLAGDAGRVIAVFQPHLYSRTRIFAAEFGAALGLADIPVVLDVYAAREDPEPGVTGKLVADAVPGSAAEYVPSAADVPAAVAALARPGDLVLTMGAGDVTRLGPRILEELAQ